MSTPEETAVGVFGRFEDAEAAADDLRAAGVRSRDVWLLAQGGRPAEMGPGRVVGVLEAMGVPEAVARWGEAQYRRGGILLVVRSPGHHQQVEDILLDRGATEIHPSRPVPVARHRREQGERP
ncbi:MAG: hypothetical protein HY690_00100 [Chloroflexi bacterium]|nr:hypothetical protein [Chloroflexota bacterium]